MLNRFLFKLIDNSALIVFRIIFGLLIFLESVGALFTGWVKLTLIDPEFTFSFIGFEWLQPLPENWMYVYYAIMGVFGFCVMIGYKYRISIIAFTILWTATYLMQKASYNNHYYFLCLISVVMIFLPANTCYSVDAKQNPHIKSNFMPRWSALILMFHIFLVYTYGSIAKLYPDWLDTSVFELLVKSKQHYFIIGDLLQQKWLHYFLAYGGILFDGLIIPLLLFKPTRKWAFIISVFFHLFNSIVFQVGIFPYLSLAFAVFFFEPRTIQKLFLKKKHFYDNAEVIIPKYKTTLLIILSGYLIVQLLLPLRHHLIQDNVLWTEEGHRMSWRMMLRTKGGIVKYKVIDKSNYSEIPIKLSDYLSEKQSVIASKKPDVIWQFAQYLKKDFKAKGIDVEVYVNCKISVNGKPLKQLIDPEIDLASVKWNAFKHSDWILPSKQD